MWINGLIAVVRREGEQGFHYTLESSATYHLPVVLCWGGTPSIINPTLARLGVRKTDDKDSLSLAEQDLRGYWPPVYVHTPALTAIRILVKERKRRAQSATNLVRAVASGLNRFGYTFQTLGSIRTPRIRSLVEDVLLGRDAVAEAIPCMSSIPIPDDIRTLYLSHFHQADELDKAARDLQWQVRDRLRRETFWTMKGEMTGHDLLELLQTCPGVGEMTSALWLSEVGCIRRFTSAKACVAWTGFDPTLKISASKVVAHVKRKGNRVLHHAIKECACVAMNQVGHPLAEWAKGIKQKHKKGGYHKAAGAVGRKIAQALFWIHWKGEAYNPHVKVKRDDEEQEEQRDGQRADGERGTGGREPGRDGGRRARPQRSDRQGDRAAPDAAGGG